MKSKQIVFTKPCVAELIENEVRLPEANEVQVRLVIYWRNLECAE